ncbi:MAG: hypothetical protein ACLPHP_12565 [Candidatus Sulfotelmatobacter sp.]
MAASAIAFGRMGSPAVNHFIFLEATLGRVLRIWRAWFWRFALLGCVPVALAYSLTIVLLFKFSALVPLAILVSQGALFFPFWAYTYTFPVLFAKSLGGVRIRLQSTNQPQTMLDPTELLMQKVRQKWTRRSWRWGLGFLVAMLLFGLFEADDWLKRPNLLTGSNSDSFVESFLIAVLFFGTPVGWLVGTAMELKSIFKEDFGGFRVCLTSEPDLGQQSNSN